MKKLGVALLLLSVSVFANAAEYVIDTKGMHAFIQFRVKHLGYSWLYGRFNDFSGDFTYDKKDPSKNKINVEIDVASLDSNHALRDKHLKSSDFLHVEKYPTAKFVSKKYEPVGDDKAKLTGDFTLHGKTKSITIDVEYIGGGSDPWGGYRDGFEGRVTIKPEEWGVNMAQLGPASAEVELMLTVEGVRKDK